MRTAWLLIVMPRSRSMSMRSRYCARMSRSRHDAGDLQHPVGKRRLAVVDVGDDAEVADERGVGRGRLECCACSWTHWASLRDTEPVQLPSPRHAGSVDPWLPRSFAHGARETTLPSLQEGINVANIKSQIKRIGTNKKAQDRNKAVKSEVKTAVRATRDAITAGDKEKATASLAARGQEARQGRQQGCHPQEPGREPQVGDRQAGCCAVKPTSRWPSLQVGAFVRERG